MEFVQILSFIVVATILVVSPGPNGLLIAKTVPSSGKTAGFANIVGFIAAFAVHGCLSVLGISLLIMHSGQAFFVFKMLGAVYLAWLGIKAIYGAWTQTDKPQHQAPNKRRITLLTAFAEGFLTNVLNPKVSMFYLAAFPQYIPAEGSVAIGFALVATHAAINSLWFSGMVLLLAKVKKVSISSGLAKWFKSITGFVFIAFAAKLATLKN